MATLKGVTRSKRQAVYSGKFMVDTVRGVLRVRKWPRKRGTPKSASQLYWIDWFRQANRLAKYVDGASAARAIEITAKSGMYPRDILLAAMRGRLYTWYDQNGKVWYSMAAIQDISDSLDVLAQTAGSLLVRFADRWRALVPGTAGQVLTNQGAEVAPAWQTPAAAGLAPDGCLLSKVGNQNVTSGVVTAITFEAETYDPQGLHDNTVNNTRITIPAGYAYAEFTGTIYAAAKSGGLRQVRMYKNGAAMAGGAFDQSLGSASLMPIKTVPSHLVQVTVGDYFELMFYHNAGGTIAVQASLTGFSAKLYA